MVLTFWSEDARGPVSAVVFARRDLVVEHCTDTGNKLPASTQHSSAQGSVCCVFLSHEAPGGKDRWVDGCPWRSAQWAQSRKESSGMLAVFYLSAWSLGADSDTTGVYICRTLRVVNFIVNHFMHFTIWTLSKRALKNYLYLMEKRCLW